jgi:hypothetical protein
MRASDNALTIPGHNPVWIVPNADIDVCRNRFRVLRLTLQASLLNDLISSRNAEVQAGTFGESSVTFLRMGSSTPALMSRPAARTYIPPAQTKAGL